MSENGEAEWRAAGGAEAAQEEKAAYLASLTKIYIDNTNAKNRVTSDRSDTSDSNRLYNTSTH
jgi:hypothetical protein